MALDKVKRLGLWSPFKELDRLVSRTLQGGPGLAEFEEKLLDMRHLFSQLLQFQKKNPDHRKEVQSLAAGSHNLPISLSCSDISVLVKLSDVFDINEYSSLELVLSAKEQMASFPGSSLLQVAVVLLHDGRLAVFQTLCNLIAARSNGQVDTELRADLVSFVQNYIDKLIDEGLFPRMLACLKNMDPEQDALDLVNAGIVTGPQLRLQLFELVEGQRRMLSQSVMLLAVQKPLSKDLTTHLIHFLRTNSSVDQSQGTLDYVTFKLLVAVLNSLSGHWVEEHGSTEKVESLPYLSDRSMMKDLRVALLPNEWCIPEMRSLLLMSWLVLADTLVTDVDGFQDLLNPDGEAVLQEVLACNVFQFIRKLIIPSPILTDQEEHVKPLDYIMKAFIISFPLKIKELRMRHVEAQRLKTSQLVDSAGLVANTIAGSLYVDLCFMIGEFYSAIKNKFSTEYCLDFWSVAEASFSPGQTIQQQSWLHHRMALQKFVMMVSDHVTTSEFPACLSMLCGLASGPQSSLLCFHLLYARHNLSRGVGGVITWDHFFDSLKRYFMSFRKEAHSLDERFVPTSIAQSALISPEEVFALDGVLHLMVAICDQSPVALSALADSRTWLVVPTLFGLLGCAIPLQLKVSLLNVLSSLARSEEIAQQIWVFLDESQIIPTSDRTSAQTSTNTGIVVELEEIEAKNETYPLTLAFLGLLNALTESAIPPMLGLGSRTPGFDPYLNFLVNSVLLRFHQRAYIKPAEKWTIGRAVLQLLAKLVMDFNPSDEHFFVQPLEVQQVNIGVAPKPPGFHLMVLLHHEGPFIYQLLNLVENAVRMLELTPSTTPLLVDLNTCLENCLTLLLAALDKEETFLQFAREYALPLNMTSLHHLLMLQNPHNGARDYIYYVAKSVCLQKTLASIPVTAVKILCHVCKSPVNQPHLVGILSLDKARAIELMAGFADKLETIETDYGPSTEAGSLPVQILEMLVASSGHPFPNVTHFLLGFALKRSALSKPEILDPGVRGFPKTCIHAVFSLLNTLVTVQNLSDSTGLPALQADVVRLSYRLLAILATQPEVSDALIMYTRSCQDLVLHHLEVLGSIVLDEVVLCRSTTREALSWLLRLVAQDLCSSALDHLRSRVKDILVKLLQVPSEATATPAHTLGAAPVSGPSFSQSLLSQSAMFTQTGQSSNQPLLVRLVSQLDMSMPGLQEVDLVFFDRRALNKLVSSCEMASSSGLHLCDIGKLRAVIDAEVHKSPKKHHQHHMDSFNQEVVRIIKFMENCNQVRQDAFSSLLLFNSWCSLLEVALVSCPRDIVGLHIEVPLLLKVLCILAAKICSEDSHTDLITDTPMVFVIILEYLLTSINGGLRLSEPGRVLSELFSMAEQLLTLLTSLDSTVTHLRGGLYSVIVYVFHIYKALIHTSGPSDDVTLHNHELHNVFEVGFARCFLNSGEVVMELMARDCCSGKDIQRLLVLTLLTHVVEHDRNGYWSGFLHRRGCMKALVETLLADNKSYITLLLTGNQDLRSLYVCETVMKLLTVVAQSEMGALLCIQTGIVEQLSGLRFFDERSYLAGSSTLTRTVSLDFAAPPWECYLRLVLPVLEFLCTLVSTLGAKNREVLHKVWCFLCAHDPSFTSVITGVNSISSLAHLEELCLLVQLHATCILFEDPSGVEMSATTSGGLYKNTTGSAINEEYVSLKNYCSQSVRLLQQLLVYLSCKDNLSLLSKAALESTTLDSNLSVVERESATLQVEQLLVRTQAAIIQMSVWHVKNGHGAGNQLTSSQLLLGPFLSRTAPDLDDRAHGRMPTMGCLVELLAFSLDQFVQASRHTIQWEVKSRNSHGLSPDAVQKLIGDSSRGSATGLAKSFYAEASGVLSGYLKKRKNLLEAYRLLIEQGLYLLWTHAEHYLVYEGHAEDRTQHPRVAAVIAATPAGSNMMSPRKQPTTSGLPVPVIHSRDVIHKLRSDLHRDCGEAFWENFASALKTDQAWDMRFVNVMIRSLRRLIGLTKNAYLSPAIQSPRPSIDLSSPNVMDTKSR